MKSEDSILVASKNTDEGGCEIELGNESVKKFMGLDVEGSKYAPENLTSPIFKF